MEGFVKSGHIYGVHIRGREGDGIFDSSHHSLVSWEAILSKDFRGIYS